MFLIRGHVFLYRSPSSQPKPPRTPYTLLPSPTKRRGRIGHSRPTSFRGGQTNDPPFSALTSASFGQLARPFPPPSTTFPVALVDHTPFSPSPRPRCSPTSTRHRFASDSAPHPFRKCRRRLAHAETVAPPPLPRSSHPWATTTLRASFDYCFHYSYPALDENIANRSIAPVSRPWSSSSRLASHSNHHHLSPDFDDRNVAVVRVARPPRTMRPRSRRMCRHPRTIREARPRHLTSTPPSPHRPGRGARSICTNRSRPARKR